MKNSFPVRKESISKKALKIGTGVGITGLITVLTARLIFKNKVVHWGLKFIGEYEIYQNQGFVNKGFEKLMRMVGWYPGAAWCIFFVKLLYYLANKDRNHIQRVLTGHTITSWNNAKKDTSGSWSFPAKPKPGDIFILEELKNGVLTGGGHGGVVYKAHANYFQTIEGNTNEEGSRVGVKVDSKTRQYTYNATNGMRLKGFMRYKG